MSKEHAYAYEAGYRDGSIHYELEHCPACKNIADLQEALAENAKLRDGAAKMARWYDEELKAALDENAKLRELCKELAEFLTEAEWLQWPELRAEMQRLGIEVG